MYIFVRDIVTKCTERQEGAKVCEACQDPAAISLQLDFDGVINVSEDFVCAFLSGFNNFTQIKKISYVRTKPYIKKKFQKRIALLRR